jgi:hypothetical protein
MRRLYLGNDRLARREDFETEPVPVQVVYAQTRPVTGKVRAFVDECVSRLRQARLD